MCGGFNRAVRNLNCKKKKRPLAAGLRLAAGGNATGRPAQIWRWNTANNEDERARVRMCVHRVSQANEVNQASMLDAAFSCCSQSQQVEVPRPPGRPKKGHFNAHSNYRIRPRTAELENVN